MSEITAGSPTRIRRKPVLIFAGVALLLAVLVGGYFFYQARMAGPLHHRTYAVSAQDIEAKWGIVISQIAMTADNGMIDMRYKVIDPDKAIGMVHDVNNMPVLLTEDGRSLINSAAMMAEKHDLKAGETYFILYRNMSGAVKAGSKVTIVFGDERLEHQPVK